MNQKVKTNTKRLIKETKKFIDQKDKDAAIKKYSEASKSIDKASKRYLHKNTAARIKSKLAKKLNQI